MGIGASERTSALGTISVVVQDDAVGHERRFRADDVVICQALVLVRICDYYN